MEGERDRGAARSVRGEIRVRRRSAQPGRGLVAAEHAPAEVDRRAGHQARQLEPTAPQTQAERERRGHRRQRRQHGLAHEPLVAKQRGHQAGPGPPRPRPHRLQARDRGLELAMQRHRPAVGQRVHHRDRRVDPLDPQGLQVEGRERRRGAREREEAGAGIGDEPRQRPVRRMNGPAGLGRLLQHRHLPPGLRQGAGAQQAVVARPITSARRGVKQGTLRESPPRTAASTSAGRTPSGTSRSGPPPAGSGRGG